MLGGIAHVFGPSPWECPAGSLERLAWSRVVDCHDVVGDGGELLLIGAAA